MTPGIIRLASGDYTVSPAGWSGPDPAMVTYLTTFFPVEQTEPGSPMVQAFHAAVKQLGAESVQEPAPAEYPSNARL